MVKGIVAACLLFTAMNLAILLANWSIAAHAQEKLVNDPFENRIFRAEIEGFVKGFIQLDCRVSGQNILCKMN